MIIGMRGLAAIFAGLGASVFAKRKTPSRSPRATSVSRPATTAAWERGYPGAKLARKAAEGRIAICHGRGRVR